MARAKVTALKLWYDGDDSNSNIGGGFNGDGVGDTNNKSDDESNVGVGGHKTNDGVNDGGCINFIKKCFENKHIDVANFTRSSLSKGNLWNKNFLLYRFALYPVVILIYKIFLEEVVAFCCQYIVSLIDCCSPKRARHTTLLFRRLLIRN